MTIAEIAREIGVAERTFYRYFPVKAETVGPIFDWTTRTFDTAVAQAAEDVPLRDVLRRGFRAMLGGEHAERTARLFPLVFADPQMWSLFLRKVHDGERALNPVLAPRLGLDPTAPAARAASAAIASATRIALELMVTDGVDPEQQFTVLIDAFAAGASLGTASALNT